MCAVLRPEASHCSKGEELPEARADGIRRVSTRLLTSVTLGLPRGHSILISKGHRLLSHIKVFLRFLAK